MGTMLESIVKQQCLTNSKLDKIISLLEKIIESDSCSETVNKEKKE